MRKFWKIGLTGPRTGLTRHELVDQLAKLESEFSDIFMSKEFRSWKEIAAEIEQKRKIYNQDINDIDYDVDTRPIVTERIAVQTISRRKNASVGISLLKAFRWFLPRSRRADIDLIIDDLKQDRREMKEKKCSAWLIQAALLSRSLVTIAIYAKEVVVCLVHWLIPFLQLKKVVDEERVISSPDEHDDIS